MHICIADQCVEGKAPDKFSNIILATLGTYDLGNIASAGPLVFLMAPQKVSGTFFFYMATLKKRGPKWIQEIRSHAKEIRQKLADGVKL